MNFGAAGNAVAYTGAGTLAFCALCAWRLRKKLRKRLGPVNWDFNTSWASNLGGIGSILGIVGGATGTLPSTGLIAGQSATGLGVFFGVLIVLAPFTYTALLAPAPDAEPKGDPPPLVAGVWAFVLASGLTLWGVAGVIVTAWAVFFDTRHLPGPVLGALVLGLLIGLAILATYAWRSIGWIVKFQTVKPPPEPPAEPGFAPDAVLPGGAGGGGAARAATSYPRPLRLI